ncbi:ABC transporter ATP-binding protein [Psychrobacillus sp. FSL K6-2365]|uniref:ABC transporter ATP-binding protein n=1 Tax=Psychrobacillus TaxID=1221880 RepID=UPI0008E27D6C|nr:ABC transporter ATP-binding protein [Psychrobacillus psychrodurans]MCZ8541592.1 ABC transporter ATP-binding protein [Psychrobacillus psychrodurans]SFN06001.1 ABC-2 type transport system ATP-binding protein [Psychrobacillus psychrodurans]
MSKPIVQLKNITKIIRGKTLIDNMSLELFPGQITGFLGPNGAGKTTTIRLMTGLMHLTSGTITIEGASIADDYEKAIANVGVIVENPEMYKYMSGYKNLLHFSRMHNGVTKARIDEVINQVGLTKRIHEKVSTYSLGMRQRLGLAQALLHDPKFLILDEPTNGLDPAGIREFRTYLRKIAQENNVSIFVSSHLLSEIELMCDRVVVIQNGKLIDERMIQSDEKTRMQLKAEPSGVVENYLSSNGYVFTLHEGVFLLDLKEEKVPVLINELVAQQVQIFAISAVHETLEEQFLQMTGGGQIV